MIIDYINNAAKIIKEGGVVAFPTETVYGLGASAYNKAACAKIYQLKQRPMYNPLIVHVVSLAEAFELGYFNEQALKLTSFWPGPLTIVVKIKENSPIAANILAGRGTIALRMPNHKTALSLIELTGPIAAPSANKSGYISATNHIEVEEDFGGLLPVLKGNITYGIESTIVKAYDDDIAILRHGFITSGAIETLLGFKLHANKSSDIEAPGQLLKHYSPKTLVKLNNIDFDNDRSVFLTFGKHDRLKSNQIYFNLSLSGNLTEAAANLYSYMRKLDTLAIANNYQYIAISPIPNSDIGIAINDRILRAAAMG